jgi:hypothetical protein
MVEEVLDPGSADIQHRLGREPLGAIVILAPQAVFVGSVDRNKISVIVSGAVSGGTYRFWVF